MRQAERGEGGVRVFLDLAAILGMEVAGRSLPPGDGLGTRLKALRDSRKLSMREVAAMAGCSPTTVAAVERDGGGHLAVLERIAEALGAGLTLVGQGRRPTFVGTAATSSAYHAWATPADLLEKLYPLVGGRFDVDPCSPGRAKCRVQARTHYTEQDDGLSFPWFGRVYMNPPYGPRVGTWTAKAREESAEGRTSSVIGLLPARTDTRWWHRDISGVAHVWLLKGRLAFGDGRQSAPFPSALVLWGGSEDIVRGLTRTFSDAQHVARRPPGLVTVAIE